MNDIERRAALSQTFHQDAQVLSKATQIAYTKCTALQSALIIMTIMNIPKQPSKEPYQ